jgi:hypothetical protein
MTVNRSGFSVKSLTSATVKLDDAALAVDLRSVTELESALVAVFLTVMLPLNVLKAALRRVTDELDALLLRFLMVKLDESVLADAFLTVTLPDSAFVVDMSWYQVKFCTPLRFVELP